MDLSPLEPFPILTTERLHLGPLQVCHASGVLETLGDPEVTRYHDLNSLEDRDAALHFIAEMIARHFQKTGLRWAVTEKSTSRYLGTVGLNHITPNACSCSIGYEFARSVWGRGFGTEAVAAAVAFAHGPLRLNRIEASVLPGNQASLRLLSKLGFADEGLLRALGFWKGEFRDLRVLSLLSSNPSPPG